MKFISFRVDATPRYGAVTDNGIVDLTGRLTFADLKALIAAGATGEAANAARGAMADYTIDQVTFDPVIPNPEKILCIGVNYEAHRQESGRAKSEYPTIFTRFADTQMGHLQPVIVPRVSDEVDYEGELAVIIGKSGRHVSEAKAMDYVAGYSCYQDASVRDYQRHTAQFTPGKNFPGTGGFGPYLVTPDDAGALPSKRVRTRLNGEMVQDATLDMMIFSIGHLIEYISSFTKLNPGDVIATGTPAGVGALRNPPLWMKPGDKVEVDIEGIGLLVNNVVAET